MRLTIGRLAEKVVAGGQSKKRIHRKETGRWEKLPAQNDAIEQQTVANINKTKKGAGVDYRTNEMGIQMLSRPLYEQVFRNTVPRTSKKDAINR